MDGMGILIHTSYFKAGRKGTVNKCSVLRMMNRRVEPLGCVPDRAALVEKLRRWGEDAVEIYMDGSYKNDRTLVEHMVGHSNRVAAAAVVKKTVDGKWVALRIDDGVKGSVHCSCFNVELMALVCALVLLGGRAVRRSDSQAAVKLIAKWRNGFRGFMIIPSCCSG